MNLFTYKSLEISEDHFMLLEQSTENPFLSRIYSISISFEDKNFGIYNTRNEEGFNKIGGSSQDNEWHNLTFEEFIEKRKQFGSELQDSLDNLLEMTESENFECYEGTNYIVHVPKYKFRISGPNKKYSFSKDPNINYESYFLKTTDNDWRLNETISNNYIEIPKENLKIIIDTWSDLLTLLMTDSKYAHGIY